MQTRALGPMAGLSWLRQAIHLGRNNPRAVFGAAGLLMLVALVPTVVQLFAQFALGVTDARPMMIVTLVTTLAMLLVYPLLIGGFLQVIDAAEHGRPTHATALFGPFRAGAARGRLIAFFLLMVGLYVLATVAVLSVVNAELLEWFVTMATLAQNATPGALPELPPAPEGMGTLWGLMLLVMMFLGGVSTIGFGQVSLTDRSAVGALADGMAGTVKNVLPLVVLAVVVLALLFVVMLGLGLAMVLLMALGALVHATLGMALFLPLYLIFLVASYVVMFGTMYFMWRDVCGEPAVHTLADDRVEL
jgi:hypothetical protein